MGIPFLDKLPLIGKLPFVGQLAVAGSGGLLGLTFVKKILDGFKQKQAQAEASGQMPGVPNPSIDPRMQPK